MKCNYEITNPNYCATIVEINKTIEVPWLDNLVQTSIYWYNILVNKSAKKWDKFILFTAETQLDSEFLYYNNLYRHCNLNKDTEQKGFFEDNWRVKAIKFKGVSSNWFLMPISSLSYLDIKEEDLEVWDSFNIINWREICRKYILPEKKTNWSNKIKGNNKKYQRLDWVQFPEHFDTENYFRNEFKYEDTDRLIITQKLHWTSVRLWNVKVKIKPTLWDKILRRQRYEYDYITGSRRVIKDLKSDTQFNHYYDTYEWTDIYNRALGNFKNIVPKDTILYWEIIWYNWSSPIQTNYTYNCIPWEFEVYIYRIVSINSDNQTIDWSWEAIKEFCNNNWIKYVPELEITTKKEFEVEKYLDKNFIKEWINWVVGLDEEFVDEWICIRKEGIKPFVTKAKSPEFLIHETKLLDKGETNLEDNQS